MKREVGALLVLSLLAACGSSPKTQFFTLDPVAGSQAPPARLAAPVVVGHVQLPGELDRQALVTHAAGERIDVSDMDHWAAPLDELTRRALTSDLRTRLPAGTVLAEGDPAPRDARTLTLNVHRFMADQSGRVTLDADWGVQGRGVAASHHLVVTADAAGTRGDAIAIAMSQALGKLADRVAAAL